MAGVTPGNVPVGPPPPGDPESLATTPAGGQTHDIVLGGVGFTLYRDQDDSLPSKVYGHKPVDYSYSPVFAPRNSIAGDFGDDQQDFFWQQRQSDWSGGEGRRYFRTNEQGGSDSFLMGGNIMPSARPGEVRMVASPTTDATVITTTHFSNAVFVKGTGQIGGTNDPKDTLVVVSGTSGTSVQMRYSTDGGANWTLQGSTAASAQPWKDCVDMCVGEDGYIYALEGSITTTQCRVHRIKGPSLATIAWDNWTSSPLQANCICYWQTGVYIADQYGRICLVTVTTGAKTVVGDPGAGGQAGGIFLQLLATPEGIYGLFLTPGGQYRIYKYDGSGGGPSGVTHVATLPNGWKTQYLTEAGVFANRTASGIFALQQDFMVWSEGILYVTGLMPARDFEHARGNETRFHTALYYFAAGNGGLVWVSDKTRLPYQWGGAGSCAVISDGMIAFTDMPNDCVRCYDPRTGAVFMLSQGLYTVADFQEVSGIGSATVTTALAATTATTLTCSNAAKIPPGSILWDDQNDQGEIVSVDENNANGGFAATPLQLIRGFDYTTEIAGTFGTTGGIVGVAAPPFPPRRMAYDSVNGAILFSYNTLGNQDWGTNVYRPANLIERLDLRKYDLYTQKVFGPATGWLVSPAFDYGSSLNKWFHSVTVDFDSYQFDNAHELAGDIFAFVTLDQEPSPMFDPYQSGRPQGGSSSVGTDHIPLNAVSRTVLASFASSTSTTIQFGYTGSSDAIVAGDLLLDHASGQEEIVYVVSVSYGSTTQTVTAYRDWNLGGIQQRPGARKGVGLWTVGNPAYHIKRLVSGTAYAVDTTLFGNPTGKRLYVTLLFMPGGTSPSALTASLGPVLFHVTVKAAPVVTGRRRREYAIAMFNNQERIGGFQETRTPAQMRAALETLLTASVPITVTDASMTNVLCAIDTDQVTIREIRPNEYVAYVVVREI